MAGPTIFKGGALSIATVNQESDLDQAGYEALTWTEIGCIVTMPDFGFTTNIVTQNCIADDVAQKQGGITTASDTEVMVSYDPDDTGQDSLRTAADGNLNWAFKLELDDGVTTNTIKFARGIVAGDAAPGGGVEEFVNETFSIGLNQKPILVKPT